MIIPSSKSLIENLQHFFGFDSFKGEQEAIVQSVLDGKDTFVIMPTGGGKSMCYQLPALMKEGTAIVISPLIALMKNQVDQIRTFGGFDEIAHFLNSSLNKTESNKVKEDVISGVTKLLYVAPESLSKQENVDFLQKINISFVAVDEAHCISEWGHDFRPEYRKIRSVIAHLGDNIPIVALTATATPKVQQDIQKNLQMNNAKTFKSSFNRSNLFYEVRPKDKDTDKDIVKFVKSQAGKSGIIYCLSRKKVEEIAELLNLNNIKALPYHAGLEAKLRSGTQDNFLMEDVDVIVATIAFGMGIDKPDVRYVIHYDIPKSLEGYYQETGRSGRDGGEGYCLTFYSEKDIERLIKFMKDKPVAEREIGTQILKEVIDYSESPVCRRKQILHYFGEKFNDTDCNKKCDNCCKETNKYDAQTWLGMLLGLIQEIGEVFDDEYVIKILMGEEDAQLVSYNHHKISYFGKTKDENVTFIKSLIRQAVLHDFLSKDIELYGLLKLTEQGKAYIENPYPITFLENHKVNPENENKEDASLQAGGGSGVLDSELFELLKDLRKKIAKQNNLPPFVIFQDPSLEEMCTHYPISVEELKQISGVGAGKALKFGAPFAKLIAKYVEDNDIERPQDFVIKSSASKSQIKVFIIQSIDRKCSLEDIAVSKGLDFDELLREIESIVNAGTKINITYYINEIMDEEKQSELYEYFRTAETDSIDQALIDLGEDYFTREEVQLMRIKFMSEMGN